MNKADSEAGSKAIDSLINYETVKVCFAKLEREGEREREKGERERDYDKF